jgi:hypothetical protein
LLALEFAMYVQSWLLW